MMNGTKCERCGSSELAAHDQRVTGHVLCIRCFQQLEEWLARSSGIRTSLSLKAARMEEPGVLVATYSGAHSQGGRNGTTLDFTFELKIDTKLRPGRITVENVSFGELSGETPEAALARIGNWLERAGVVVKAAVENMRQQGQGSPVKIVSLPLFLPLEAKPVVL